MKNVRTVVVLCFPLPPLKNLVYHPCASQLWGRVAFYFHPVFYINEKCPYFWHENLGNLGKEFRVCIIRCVSSTNYKLMVQWMVSWEFHRQMFWGLEA